MERDMLVALVEIEREKLERYKGTGWTIIERGLAERIAKHEKEIEKLSFEEKV